MACDHPGTPNPVAVHAIYRDAVDFDVTNTAREGGSGTHIWFGFDGGTDGVRWQDFGAMRYGQKAEYIFNKLTPNQNHCFRVWTRDDSDKGCRSKLPSGWVCAFTDPKLPAQPPPVQAPFNGPIGVCQPRAGVPGCR
jgi:hypothetical protein